ncbi:MAG: metal ABC transporter permease [Deltaproteobacteria bacterium]|nr:metal ABC transporter permease [Deltaproteobacteria bacterium]
MPDNIFYYSIIFFAGLIISGSLNIVGGMLIFTLLVNPASAAYQITYKLKTMFFLSATFGIISCLAGLIFSYLFNVPTGAVIVLASSVIFLLAFILSPKRRVAKSV